MPLYLKAIRDELTLFGRSTRKYPKYRVTQLTTRSSKRTRSISYKSVVTGDTNNYSVHLQFFKVEYLDAKPDDTTNFKATKIDDQKVWYKVPSVRSNPANLKCSCPDFRFRFEKELYDNTGLIGNWRRYVRKTPPPPIGAPYANPQHLMGYCKHIHSLLTHLRDNGNLRE